MPSVQIKEIEELTHKILSNAGFKDRHIRAIYSHFIYNELAGRASHGFVRVKWTLDYIKTGEIFGAGNDPVITIDKPAFKHIDGKGTIGILAALMATEAAIKGAKEAGSCAVGAFNYGGTTGNMGYYAKQITDASLMCIMSCTSLALVAAQEHCDPVNGTNPLCIGIPTGKDTMPIIYDSAVTPISWGDTVIAALNGNTLPENVAIDASRAPSQNAKDVVSGGALLPIAGHKGFGLGICMEILTGPLIGAKAGKSVTGSDGLYIHAIDPSCFGDLDAFYQKVSTYRDEIKNSPVKDDISLRLPGEKSLSTYEKNKNNTHIELSDAVYKTMKELAG